MDAEDKLMRGTELLEVPTDMVLNTYVHTWQLVPHPERLLKNPNKVDMHDAMVGGPAPFTMTTTIAE